MKRFAYLHLCSSSNSEDTFCLALPGPTDSSLALVQKGWSILCNWDMGYSNGPIFQSCLEKYSDCISLAAMLSSWPPLPSLAPEARGVCCLVSYGAWHKGQAAFKQSALRKDNIACVKWGEVTVMMIINAKVQCHPLVLVCLCDIFFLFLMDDTQFLQLSIWIQNVHVVWGEFLDSRNLGTALDFLLEHVIDGLHNLVLPLFGYKCRLVHCGMD